MFTPVDFISVTKQANNIKSPEVAGSIASATGSPLFTSTPETAGSIACAAPATSSCASSGSFSAVA